VTELLVGTRKGLFVLHGDGGAPFEIASRAFATRFSSTTLTWGLGPQA